MLRWRPQAPFHANANTVLWSDVVESFLRQTNVNIGVMNKLYVRSFSENLSASTSLLKYFAGGASKTFSITYSRNTSNIMCSTILYTTEQIPPLGVVIRRAKNVVGRVLNERR